MKNKIFKLMLAALACASISMFVPNNTYAAETTQATSVSQVDYNAFTLSSSEKAQLKDKFDAAYYAKENPDVVAMIGSDPDVLFNHFVTRGIYEGRSMSSAFNVSAYRAANNDLKALYGNDIKAYYNHYLTKGCNENRIATLDGCAKAGIAVQSIVTGNAINTSSSTASLASTKTAKTTSFFSFSSSGEEAAAGGGGGGGSASSQVAASASASIVSAVNNSLPSGYNGQNDTDPLKTITVNGVKVVYDASSLTKTTTGTLVGTIKFPETVNYYAIYLAQNPASALLDESNSKIRVMNGILGSNKTVTLSASYNAFPNPSQSEPLTNISFVIVGYSKDASIATLTNYIKDTYNYNYQAADYLAIANAVNGGTTVTQAQFKDLLDKVSNGDYSSLSDDQRAYIQNIIDAKSYYDDVKAGKQEVPVDSDTDSAQHQKYVNYYAFACENGKDTTAGLQEATGKTETQLSNDCMNSNIVASKIIPVEVEADPATVVANASGQNASLEQGQNASLENANQNAGGEQGVANPSEGGASQEGGSQSAPE